LLLLLLSLSKSLFRVFLSMPSCHCTPRGWVHAFEIVLLLLLLLLAAAAVPLAGVAVLLLLSLSFYSFTLLRLFLHSRNYEIKRGVAGSLLIAAAAAAGAGGGGGGGGAAVTAILQLTK